MEQWILTVILNVLLIMKRTVHKVDVLQELNQRYLDSVKFCLKKPLLQIDLTNQLYASFPKLLKLVLKTMKNICAFAFGLVSIRISSLLLKKPLHFSEKLIACSHLRVSVMKQNYSLHHETHLKELKKKIEF